MYGAKGLHVTQVMPSPDPIYSALLGGEMIDNGSGQPTEVPPHDWVWVASGSGGYWSVSDWNDSLNGLGPRATFAFQNLMPGYYALRLIGTANTFTVTYPISGAATYAVTPSVAEPETALMTGFVRKPPDHGCNRLVCFQVPSSGTLSFQLQAPLGSRFWGFALCAQYIQLTNISTHDILLSNLTVTTDQGLLLAPNGTQPWALNYTRADDGYVDLRRIPGATVGVLGWPIAWCSTALFDRDIPDQLRDLRDLHV